MKRRLISVAAVLLFVLAGISSASASGFALYEYSARGNALGGAVIGRADDPSTIVTNPAGITQLEGTQIAAGASFIMPNMDVSVNGNEVHGQNNIWVPPHFYVTHKYNDKWSFGVGLYSRFGLGTEFDADWAGRYNVTEAVIQTYSINPNVAYKVNDKLSLAVGVEYINVKMDIQKKMNLSPAPLPDDLSQTKAEGSGYALTLGLLYQINDQWKFGVGYHSQAEINAEGDLSFATNYGAPFNLVDTDVEGSVVLPDMLNIGLTYYPTKDLSIEVGGVLTRWSTYNELRFEFDDPVGPTSSYTSVTPKDWKDVWRYNIGVEYKALDWLTLRCGYTYDESPLNENRLDYLIPGNDRQLYSAGVGFNWQDWTLDLSYTYLWMKGRDYGNTVGVTGVQPDSHSKNARTDIYGITVGYKF
ncbi:OmpP1/FadL family transporter [Desulfovibrio mangrovi]|uniref:OmpP1/FadL family transporter n=1 Tax=Desulfovibrio mangrovi TaxID=2976983 RepID=UPI00224577BF|nr:OmpP1/FadL family transporter [Desulfovibrio mangrovi]UZP68656.1 OmpP1/FadL family transporter [Desulfovibrio mangrovi]